MARGKQKPKPGEGDREFVIKAMQVLGLSQRQLAILLGFSPAAVSFCVTHNSRLQPATRQELKRRMAWHLVAKALAEGRALTAFKPCRGNTIVDFTEYMLHFEQCPTCMVRTFIQVTRRK